MADVPNVGQIVDAGGNFNRFSFGGYRHIASDIYQTITRWSNFKFSDSVLIKGIVVLQKQFFDLYISFLRKHGFHFGFNVGSRDQRQWIPMTIFRKNRGYRTFNMKPMQPMRMEMDTCLTTIKFSLVLLIGINRNFINNRICGRQVYKMVDKIDEGA